MAPLRVSLDELSTRSSGQPSPIGASAPVAIAHASAHYRFIVAVKVNVRNDGVHVDLSGGDRLMCWRTNVVFDSANVASARTLDRSSLESFIDHRNSGRGTHDGSQRPNRHRIGSMLGRGVAGKQFWAVPAGPSDARLLVLDLHDHEFARAVLAIESAETIAAAIESSIADSEGSD